MGYESVLFVVNKTKLKIGAQPYGEVLAKINLCKTGHEFVNIFSGHYTMCNVYDADINHITKTVDGVDFSLPTDKYDVVLVDTILKKESLPTKVMYARNKDALDRDVIRVGKEKDVIGYEVVVICY